MAFEKLTQEQLIAKINKIMALAANNPNEEEAASAAAKAQALLAEYNLTHADLSKADKPMSDTFVFESTKTKRWTWEPGLGLAVAQLYFCAYFHRDYRNEDMRQHMFVGAKHNTEIAWLMFEYLSKTTQRLAQAGCKGLPKREHSPYRTEFRIQCSLRLQNRLIKRRRQAEQGEAKAVEIMDDGSAVETTRNLPALLTTYKQELDRATSYMNSKYKIKMVKTKLATGLHAKGAADGARAGEAIGLDPQVGKSNQRHIG